MIILTQLLAALFLAKFFVSFILGVFFDKSDKKLKSSSSYQNYNLSQGPLVTVLIPAWNEELGIVKTISSVLDSTYKNVELIVINDGSKDNTSRVANDFIVSQKEQIRIKCKVIDQENKGKASALNNGIKNSTGKFILTIDADSYLDRVLTRYR